MNRRYPSAQSLAGELLTAAEAAEYSGLATTRTFQRWARDGKVPHVRLPNGRVRFRRADIGALLRPVVPRQDEEPEDAQPELPIEGW